MARPQGKRAKVKPAGGKTNPKTPATQSKPRRDPLHYTTPLVHTKKSRQPKSKEKVKALIGRYICLITGMRFDPHFLHSAHILARSLRNTHPKTYALLVEHIGIRVQVDGEWVKILNLDTSVNQEIFCAWIHLLFDGTSVRKNIGQGAFALVPVDIRPFLAHIAANRGKNYRELFPEKTYKYKMIGLTNKGYCYWRHKGAARTYTHLAHDTCTREDLEREDCEDGSCADNLDDVTVDHASSVVVVEDLVDLESNGDFNVYALTVGDQNLVLVSHINPVFVIFDYAMKMRYRINDPKLKAELLDDDIAFFQNEVWPVVSCWFDESELFLEDFEDAEETHDMSDEDAVESHETTVEDAPKARSMIGGTSTDVLGDEPVTAFENAAPVVNTTSPASAANMQDSDSNEDRESSPFGAYVPRSSPTPVSRAVPTARVLNALAEDSSKHQTHASGGVSPQLETMADTTTPSVPLSKLSVARRANPRQQITVGTEQGGNIAALRVSDQTRVFKTEAAILTRKIRALPSRFAETIAVAGGSTMRRFSGRHAPPAESAVAGMSKPPDKARASASSTVAVKAPAIELDKHPELRHRTDSDQKQGHCEPAAAAVNVRPAPGPSHPSKRLMHGADSGLLVQQRDARNDFGPTKSGGKRKLGEPDPDKDNPQLAKSSHISAPIRKKARKKNHPTAAANAGELPDPPGAPAKATRASTRNRDSVH